MPLPAVRGTFVSNAMKSPRTLITACAIGIVATAALAETNAPALFELHIKTVVVAPDGRSPVVMAVDKESNEFLPIWIGLNEAQAIMMELQKVKPPRPMTHDLTASLINELGGKVQRLVITEMVRNTYYAKLIVLVGDKTKELDCRPSDGIAIALRTGAPVFAANDLRQHLLPMPDEAQDADIQAQEIAALKIHTQTVTRDLAVAFGINEVRGVLVSASENDRLKVGDIILGVGTTDTNSSRQLRETLEKADATKPVEIRLLRDGKPVSQSVTLEPAKK